MQIILLIDAVNNGFSELAYMREGIERFLRANGGHLALPVSIAVLTKSGVQVQSRASTDGNALARTLSQMGARVRPRGGDEFPLSILALDRIAKDEISKPGRKFLIWLGNGWPTELQVTRNIVSTPAAERDQRTQFNDMVLLSTDLREARRIVTEGWGGEIAERLFETYPRIALTDQYIDCEDPDDVVEKKSFFGFLKKAQSR